MWIFRAEQIIKKIIVNFNLKLNFELFPGFSEVKISLKPRFCPVLLVFFKLFYMLLIWRNVFVVQLGSYRA